MDREGFVNEARAWLSARLPAKIEHRQGPWGEGADDVAVFHNLSLAEEAALLERLMAWQREKADAGYAGISWPEDLGGAGLSPDYERAFHELESTFETPRSHETFRVTVGLIAPTVRQFGTLEQKRRLIPGFFRGAALCCQLFSEPSSGSDLAGLRTRAVPDGDDWVVNGQKVWSSGAQFSAWGELICRTDPEVPKHAGQTAFLLPMDSPGVEVRPIRQMSGGSSFNEVFFTDVRIPDELRLGDVGQGWQVALTTLGFERSSSGGEGAVGGSWPRVLALATWLGKQDDPVVRQALADLYIHDRVRHAFVARRAASPKTGEGPPGPHGSISKLMWTQWMTAVSGVVSQLLGPRLAANTGEWGTFAWNQHLLGAPGYRIAGGSDEIQRNIIGERLLGLPGDIRVDRGMPWREIPHGG